MHEIDPDGKTSWIKCTLDLNFLKSFYMKSKITILVLVFLQLQAMAQLGLLTDSLNGPIGVTVDQWGSVWLAEVGSGNNDGVISYVAKSGKKYPVITNLPSKVNPIADDVVGPWKAIPMTYGKIAVLLGGNYTLGTNFGKLAFFDLAGYKPGVDPVKSLKDTTHTFDISTFAFSTSVNMDSDPFSAVQDEDGHWYITDAGANTIIKVSKNGKEKSVFARFSGFPNPTPVGPPFIDAVPTGIVALPKYGGFLVTTLTGFPFLEGRAAVYFVDRNGNISPYTTGLTLLTDIAIDRHGTVFVNQFGKFGPRGFIFGSGQVIRLRKGHIIDTIAKGHGPGAGLAIFDGRKVYATSLFTNRLLIGTVPPEKAVVAASAALESRESPANSNVSFKIFPNPASDFLQVDWKLKDPSMTAEVSIFDVKGQKIWNQNNLSGAGLNKIDIKRFLPGAYILSLQSKEGITTQKFSVLR